MIVKVKGINVRYNGKSYVKGEELSIQDEHMREDLFDFVAEEPKNPENTGDGELEYDKITREQIIDILEKDEVDFKKSADKKELFEVLKNHLEK
ncbi:hypothetical protein [Mesobacillus stamsii]|uniref:HeH/LEM domain-containing protein n=1 Tax=Mesobacillus stamsii TaxID=225347 RepID=A0ABU0FTQ4_9BACI|nr:hypothetical protein [Mesobacillus stamsii]MDQ0412719.1 hypothetical protein [Mesobacillus stamsii]